MKENPGALAASGANTQQNKVFFKRGALDNIVHWIVHMTPAQSCAMAFALGVISVLSLAPFFFWPVLFLTFPVLVWLMDAALLKNQQKRSLKKRWLQAALLGFFFGLGYFVAGLYWMGAACLVEPDKFGWVVPFAVLGLPSFFALYYAMAMVLAAPFWGSSPFRILALVLSFSLMEWLRSWLFTGFSWNALGYALTSDDRLMQTASLVGLDGLNILAVLIFSSLATLSCAFAKERSFAGLQKQHLAFPVLAFCLLAGMFVFGVYRLSVSEKHIGDSVEGVSLRLVQPNIPQKKKWDPEYLEWQINRFLKLSALNEQGQRDDLSKTTHVIWPEVAWSFVLMGREPYRQQQISKLLPEKVQLLSGSNRFELDSGNPKFYNSLHVFDNEGKVQGTFDKKHLVPFGEYLPFKNILSSLGFKKLIQSRGDFEAGSLPRIMRAKGAPHFSPLICYEILFSGKVTEPDERPAWLLNVTNDGWYGLTTGPQQHFHQSRVRSVEEGLPLVRVAGSGISAVIDPFGRILKKLSLAEQGVIDSTLPKVSLETFYVKYRLLPFWLIWGGGFFILILCRFLKYKN